MNQFVNKMLIPLPLALIRLASYQNNGHSWKLLHFLKITKFQKWQKSYHFGNRLHSINFKNYENN